MKVLVIGATGRTGRLVVEQLVAQQHEVSVLVRHPEAMVEYKQKITVITGDATKLADLTKAVAGQEAVISTIGPPSLKATNLAVSFMTAFLKAVAVHPIKRFVNLSAWGTGNTADNHYFIMKLLRRTLLKNLFDDKDQAEALLLASNLPYVNVRPSRLGNGAARGGVHASLDGSHLSHHINRADVASFLIAQLSSDLWLRQSPLIGYAR
jgi:uncharacterized protein YbjT (DUF2867 family)